MTKVTSFVKEVMARLAGHTDEAKAIKIERKAKSSINTELAKLEGALIDAENAVEIAEENLKIAIYPTHEFSDGTVYCKLILDAEKKLNSKKQDLEDVKYSILYFKDLLSKF